MDAKPPLLPSTRVIEFTVTALAVPIVLLSKVDELILFIVSDPINPENDKVVVALVPPSYVLFDAVIPDTVKALAVTFAVVVCPVLIE